MIKLKHFIEKILKKRNLKIMLMFFLIFGCFVGLSFADDFVIPEVNEVKNDLVKIFYYVFSILSWVWIVLANLAGKLMTNDLVYGTALHLDSTLWTFWNVMKNIANFALGVLVLVSIVMNLFSLGNGKKKPIETIKNTVIAGVLIQMSWFLLAVVIDISSICVAAIGSLPSQLIVSNNELMGSVRGNLNKVVGNKVVVDYNNSEHPITVTQGEQNLTEDDILSLLDTLMPATDSLSGPLIYIGLSVFNFRDFHVQEVLDDESWGSLFLSVGFDGLILLFYTLLMLLLFLFNLFRIIILWLIIPFIPVIILIKIFDLKIFKDGTLKEILDFKNILKLIFKPVIMVGVLSIILIVLLLIKGMITINNTNLNLQDENLNIKSNCTSENVCNSTMNVGNFVNININGVKDSFADILIYVLGLCLLCFLVQVSKFSTGISFVDKPLSKLVDNAKNLITTAPIIPIPGKAPISMSNIDNMVSDPDILTKRVGINTSDQDVLKMLGLENDSIESLSENLSRDMFISNVKKIKGESSWESYQKNNVRNANKILNKMSKWNSKNQSINHITIEDFDDKKPTS